MSNNIPVAGYWHELRGEPLFGPRAAFLAAIAIAGSVVAAGLVPNNLLMPAVRTLLFVLATMFALIAWVRCSTDEYGAVSWDVAGAVVLVGIGAAALIEPNQLVSLITGAHTEL